MATHLSYGISAGDAADMADEIAGALEADEATTHLASVWNAMVARGDKIAARKKSLRRATGRARARLSVIDARWDETDSAFSRATLDAASGNRKKPPHSTFYDAASASTVNSFGVRREIEFGRRVVDVLTATPALGLGADWAERWARDTDALEGAVNARDAALRAESTIDVEAQQYIDDFNKELDALEGELLKIFSGQSHRVASFLTATRRTRRRARDEQAEEA